MNRIRLVLFDMNNRIFGPHLAAIHRILISVWRLGQTAFEVHCSCPPMVRWEAHHAFAAQQKNGGQAAAPGHVIDRQQRLSATADKWVAALGGADSRGLIPADGQTRGLIPALHAGAALRESVDSTAAAAASWQRAAEGPAAPAPRDSGAVSLQATGDAASPGSVGSVSLASGDAAARRRLRGTTEPRADGWSGGQRAGAERAVVVCPSVRPWGSERADGRMGPALSGCYPSAATDVQQVQVPNKGQQ
jgi:hypothetical protein